MNLEADRAPLEADAHGTVRVGGTRVALLSVITAFEQGATAEAIVQKFPALRLADVYAVLAYYLHHRGEVEAYLSGEREAGEKARREHEARFPQDGIRERLLRRQEEQSPPAAGR
ncbi:MAG: DUF433 domain-containing protein [Planctomycetes bacterium]|nr:DUF433 domain-containing protein [Planctomycetota bacterium]